MPGRPGTLPWNFATFSGNEPVTTLSDNFSFLNNQINDSGAGFTNYAIDTGTANNLIVTLASAPVAYEAGMMVVTTPAFTNTAASVINVNALGNVSITNLAAIALNGGEISKGAALSLVYDGTQFRIIGPCPLDTNLVAQTGNVTIECAGFTSVFAKITWTSGSNLHVTLNHVSYGIPIVLMYQNTTGSSTTFSLVISDPAGTALTAINAVTAGQSLGGAGGSILTGTGTFTLSNGNTSILMGNTYASLSAIFSR
jgi:hypothetical protein